MATVRSVDFLPEIFQTDANKQFLRATLDQLVQEPKYQKTQGFIGRTVGPGVNPNDRYVVEPNTTRANYQLEPGVVSLEPGTNKIKNTITYPGINDAVAYQGGNSARPDRLYSSEYYSWDPFVDFDTFVNFSQYFWVPDGPPVVDVASTGIPVTDNFTVTRQNGVYTFSGVSGTNPIIELVRGGSYTFQVAQNNKETVNYRVRNTGISSYIIDNQSNPTLTLVRGNTYVFNLTLNGVFPFWIKTQPTTGIGDVYSSGVTRNGSTSGLVTFTVPQDAPATLYYASQNQINMQGRLDIVDGTPGTGPGFWIQAAPGINGTIPATPNISSRDVYGVENNGEDLGTIVFNVPYKTAQNFYYNLPSIGQVDLITGLNFDQINNMPVEQFIISQGGIDGITNLEGRTLVFAKTSQETEAGGWSRTTLFDPLAPGAANNGLLGSYDTVPYSEETEIPLADRYQVWQISYVNNGGVDYIYLSQVLTVAANTKFNIGYGTVYSNTQWYKDANGVFKQIPLLSAVQDTLYYQDGTDPEIFGTIKLLEQTTSSTLFINDIIGKKNYISPNGVTFTNGLKVRFTGSVSPAIYGSGQSTITYTQTETGTNYISSLSANDLYVGQEIVFSSPTLGGIDPGTTYFVRSIAANGLKFTISEVLNGAAVTLQTGTGTSTATAISNKEYYVNGVGSAIELLPVTDFVTPESYVTATEPSDLDYLTISRASKDLNPWTRSNRWFHIDVINAAASYNNTTAILDNAYRAKRPIIQFRPGLRLWNMGTSGKQPVDIIDFEETDAFTNIEGSTGYTTDGYTLVEGSRVIFAADEDVAVRNKIFVVSFITPDSTPPIDPPYTGQPIIHLTLAADGEVFTDQNTVVLYGNTTAGNTYWYNGTAWTQAQQKTLVQQAPLYNVYDPTGISFGDSTKYQSTTFAGSKLFSYAVGDTSIIDPILQFPLQYLNINNVGDIVFLNNLYNDTFLYVVDNVSVTSDISSGSVREYDSRSTFEKLLGWQTAAVDSQIYQQFKFTYSGENLKLDVAVKDQVSIDVPVIKIYVGTQFQQQQNYTYSVGSNSTVITFGSDVVIPPGDIIEVLALSDETSRVGFYQVPINLESNPLNANSPRFTLGTIRTHYQSICENLTALSGPINGANNLRDLGNVVPYGLVILQQSAPLTLAGYFLRSKDYNIFDSIRYNSREYIKYKAQLMDAVIKQNIGFQTTGQILDTAIQDVTLGKVDTQPFYWSDMLPQGITTYSNTYTVSFITTNIFDTVQVYNYESANYLGLLVYLNEELLTRGVDYEVAIDGPRVTILTTLVVGDKITINEYSTTYGSFVPNTPTKLGLYPAWQPKIVEQESSNGLVQAIIGHDGSVTKLFGDLRDSVLLEFETRIYNNLKLDDNPVPLTVYDVLPGQFRDTGYAFSEINSILGTDLLSYCGWNKIDYKSQDFNSTNEFTWNYSSSQNKLNNENLLGAWRGIYRYFYDTQQPSLTPWEMLGFSIEPTWWQDRYGPAPYTLDNLVLWDDLEAGYVADPVVPYYLPEFARPGLTTVLPTGTQGELVSPLNSVVGGFDNLQIQKSWAVGDGGPVEASWWNSSGYAFAVMQVLAVTRPAKFFALFADRDLYRYNNEYQQYLYNNRYRLDANGIEVYGNGVSKASYINWIVDYNRITGIDSTNTLSADLKNLDVRLCYRMASFSDKQYIKLYTEKSSPNSTNTALLIPDESYDLILYKNQIFDRITYSSVAIQKTASGGYAVFGYGTTQPYFNIVASKSVGRLQTYSSGGVTIKVPTFYTDNIVQVPYGFVFESVTSVADFLLSYGKYLDKQGLSFTNVANGYVLDWPRMVNEFLYWSQQGWSDDAIINLNPLADGLTITKLLSVVDNIRAQTTENSVLDQNSREFPARNLNIVRVGNTFALQSLNDQSISFVDLNFTNYEHIIVLNNQSVFGDLIYDPTTGARQSRLNLIALTSDDWDGTVNAPGFILNQDNVQEWTGLRTYSKGEIVKYKNVYWSALKIVQPGATFNFNDWAQSDYNQIELGLLPNIANKADQLVTTYDINSANIETDTDLLSYGLIGFRPRQYLAALNLSDVSQVNVYRQFLGNKGTILSAELFKGANFGKEAADYDVYENWAVQRAVYGANANRSFFELRLNRALLNANPSLIQVVYPQQTSQADQAILLSNVWRQSYKLTSTDILPTTTELPTDIGLPTAGYVSLNDVDLTVFNINDTASLDANLDSIKVGTSIWVAKINDYDWNIYRAESVPGIIEHVCDNLDGTSRVIFNKQHGLSAGDKLIIKFFDTEVNGVYTVLSVVNLNTVNIRFRFTGDRAVANGQGLGFTLQTMRVAQASDVLNLPYANTLVPGAKVWVDNDSNGLWEVLEKQEVFSSNTVLSPKLLDKDEQYGSSIAQARNRLAVFVGSPRYNFGSGIAKGALYVYVKNSEGNYTPVSPLGEDDAILTLDSTGVRGYGNAVTFGDQTWAVAGASASLGTGSLPNVGYVSVIYRDPALGQPGVIPYAQWQLLTPHSSADRAVAGEFGYAVTMSQDERWMYVSAPGINKVYAYGRVDYQDQFIRTRGNGVTTRVYITNTIQIDQATQLKVIVDNRVLTLGVDYTVYSQSGVFDYVEFTTAPAVDVLVDIQRIYVQPFSSVTNTISLNENLFTADNIYSFSINVNNILLRPFIDYTFDEITKDVTFTPALSSASVLVNSQSYFEYVATLDTTSLGLISGARFGQSVSCSTDGRQVMIGASYQTVTGKVEAGAVYVFDRNVQRFIYGTDASSTSFTLLGTVTAPVSVIVNNVFYLNQDAAAVNATNTFVWDGANTVTINGNLQIGDVVEIETNQFRLIQAIPQNQVAEFSNYGAAVDLCSYNCSLYTGAPQSSLQAYKTGTVERRVNQSRVYGTTTSLAANATLTTGNTIRVNNQDVAVPGAWSSLSSYNKDTVVYNTSGSVTTIYRALQQVSPGIAITNTSYWSTVSSTTSLAQIYVQALAAQIVASVPNVLATVNTNGYLTVSVKNNNAAPEFNKVQVAPGSVGTAFDTLNFVTYAWTQNIQSPYPVEFGGFGSSLEIDDSALNLVVGAPKGTLYIVQEFDDGTTIFDVGATEFFAIIVQSGAVYTFDYLPSATQSITNPGKFVFGSQISSNDLYSYDLFGTAVSYNSGVLMVGSPGTDIGDSSSSNFGGVFVYENPSRQPAWTIVTKQQPVVDIRLLNSVFLYDRITSATTEFLDFINPLQGKILGAARQNIDYIGAVDPAAYNTGPVNIRGTTWRENHIGEIWWDTSTARFIDPNQDNITYASRRWSQLFTGSSVDVYQWIASPLPPALYNSEGVPKDTVSYTINSRLSKDGTIVTEYYFWVRGITVTATKTGKTLPASTVANYIESPRASGIPYIAPINASTIAIYNANEYIEAEDTIINIEFDRELTTSNVHVEYELIAQDRADGFLSTNLYRKLQDSFCGVDSFGNLVPDVNLNPAERYGVQFRPRQSMFVDRFAALKNYLTRANAVLAQFPVSENRSFNLLNSAEPEPSASSSKWNLRVANLEILGFQNINSVPLGYRYLVVTDSNNRGLWTIYTVEASDSVVGQRELVLTSVQGYNTQDYWSYINWYRPGYNSSTRVITEVNTFGSLSTLSVPVGSSVKVTANAQGKWEIYLLTDLGWERVGLQDGTIEFSAELWDYALGRFGFDVEVFDAQYYDQEPVIETRKIIQAINEELFVDDLAIERNRALVLIFNFVLSEFSAPEWLVKTSLIDVDHRIRELIPYQNYIRDNQEFVEQYIKEVKPYHVQIREFNLKYSGFDRYLGDATDFDVPAYYDTSLEIPQYISPILLPYTAGTAFNSESNVLSNTPASSTLWQTWPYSQWYSNYLLELVTIEVIDGGVGYTEAPSIEVSGYAAVPAQAVAVLNSAGQITAINITSPGSGYTAAPEIIFNGGNGTGVRAYPIMSGQGLGQNYNSSTVPETVNYYTLARSFRTVIKYDRFQYQSSVVDWESNATYQDGTLVRYDDRVWQAASPDSTAVSSPTFDLEDWTLVNAGTYNGGLGLSGVDRTMGLYVPGVNQPGLELPLLIDGVEYPGVQVYGDYFLGNPANTDVTYESEFTDVALGDRFTDINVVGGEFIGPYEGHAPEELVNGAEFDTLDMRVYTRPGADWNRNGHGFQIGTVRYTYEPAITPTYSWAGVVDHPVQVLVSNLTSGLDLQLTTDFTIDWDNQNITILTGVTTGQIINISVYELGGGSQLYRANYIGSEVGQTVTIPVNNAEIYSIAVFVNGEATTGITWEAYTENQPWNILQTWQKFDIVTQTGQYYRALQEVPPGTAITNALYWLAFVPTLETQVDFGTTYGVDDGIALVAFGYTTPQQYEWSTPQVQYVIANPQLVNTKTIQLTNSMQGTNPANLVVTQNGRRLRPAEGIEWFGDDSSVSFGLPQRGGYSQSIINAPIDVQVWVDNELQQQSFGITTGVYSVTNWTGSNIPGRQVVFNTPPAAGARILISVDTQAGYTLSGSQLQIIVPINLNDEIAITSWNDTAQQNLLTLVFQGPVVTGSVTQQGFSEVDYDPLWVNATTTGTIPATALATGEVYTIVLAGTTDFTLYGAANNTPGTVFTSTTTTGPGAGTGTATGNIYSRSGSTSAFNGDPGAYDYSQGVVSVNNDFYLQREDIVASRLWVTLDGDRLFEGIDYTVQDGYLILASGAISSLQVLAVTECTSSVVPEAMAFRIFQDMRGVQATYRITAASTTALSQPLGALDNVIYFTNASALTKPNLEIGAFGAITINGERIMYREIDLATNSVSSLLRGTAGTAAASHAVGATVYDIGRGNLLAQPYQDYVVKDTSIGDGTTSVFYAPSISIGQDQDSSTERQAIEVYVGGVRQYAYSDTTAESQYRWFVTDFDPVAIDFVVDSEVYPPLAAPPAGQEVTILVRRGVTWYAPGINEPSDGVALQDTNTVPARFLRGL